MYHVDAPIHPPYDFETLKKCFNGFSSSYSNQTTYFFGHTNYEYSIFNYLKQSPYSGMGKVNYLNYNYSMQLDESNYKKLDLWDICKTLFSSRSALYCAIQVATYMGFKYIYLLGCDHDYLTYINRTSSKHFYEDEKGIDDSMEWFSTEDFFLAYHLRFRV